MIFVNALIAFAGHLALAIALTGVFVAVYLRTTPHPELGLIKQGNVAAAIGLGGALIGFTMVMAKAIMVSQGLLETLVWGLLALIVQVLGHVALSWQMPTLYKQIEDQNIAAGVLKAVVAVALGLLSSASLTP